MDGSLLINNQVHETQNKQNAFDKTSTLSCSLHTTLHQTHFNDDWGHFLKHYFLLPPRSDNDYLVCCLLFSPHSQEKIGVDGNQVTPTPKTDGCCCQLWQWKTCYPLSWPTSSYFHKYIQTSFMTKIYTLLCCSSNPLYTFFKTNQGLSLKNIYQSLDCLGTLNEPRQWFTNFRQHP